MVLIDMTEGANIYHYKPFFLLIIRIHNLKKCYKKKIKKKINKNGVKIDFINCLL